LLTSAEVEDLLSAAVEHAGGSLVNRTGHGGHGGSISDQAAQHGPLEDLGEAVRERPDGVALERLKLG
jgi:hypothetical protein